MKLNKFLVAAAAVAVLPLSVANAEGPATQPALPVIGVNPDNAPVVETQPGFPETIEKPISVNGEGTFVGKREFKGGVNGTGLVQPELPAYGEKLVAPEVHTKPEYKAPKGTVRVDKGTEAPKADQAKKVLPKTSAVK